MTHPLLTVSKGYRPLVRAALAQGWTISRTRLGHVKLTTPDGSWTVPIPGSGRDGRLVAALSSRMRKHGLVY